MDHAPQKLQLQQKNNQALQNTKKFNHMHNKL